MYTIQGGVLGLVRYFFFGVSHFIPINLNQMFKHTPNLGDTIKSDIGGIHE